MSTVKAFNIAEKDQTYYVEKINTCLQKIEEMIVNYQPLITEQDYGIIQLNQTFKKDEEIRLNVRPLEEVQLFGIYGSTLVKIGTVGLDGILKVEVDGHYEVLQPYRRNTIRNGA